MVPRAPWRCLAGRIAQVLGQLGAQRRLDDPAGELRQQAARARDLLGLKPLQRLLELLARQQTGQAIGQLLGGTLSDDGRRALSLNGL
jgi:hypothetical protein